MTDIFRGMGIVFRANRKSDGREVAIKEMILTDKKIDNITSEVYVMKECNHDCIVKYYDSFLLKKRKLWVVMEYMNGGS